MEKEECPIQTSGVVRGGAAIKSWRESSLQHPPPSSYATGHKLDQGLAKGGWSVLDGKCRFGYLDVPHPSGTSRASNTYVGT